MDVSLFDFDLPEERIALRPLIPREAARLMQVKDGHVSDHTVADLPNILRAGDLLVFNDTKVIKASLQGIRSARSHGGGGDVNVQVNLHMKTSGDTWRAFVRPAKRLKLGDVVRFSDVLSAQVIDKKDGGDVGLTFCRSGRDLDAAIEKNGEMPLPPYIAKKRAVDEQDEQDYQTIFAKDSGSVAAPTAGLHFTDALLAQLKAGFVETAHITLHVGAGTFLPVTSDNTDDHQMHDEWFSISSAAANAINQAKAEGRRVIAVGTTALRALESSVDAKGHVEANNRSTGIFITPGYQFKVVDGLMTNFHLPKSTLFMLVSALAGFEAMKSAYKHAVETNYRFYSYGDTSLLWKR